jgi:hypothetical protein
VQSNQLLLHTQYQSRLHEHHLLQHRLPANRLSVKNLRKSRRPTKVAVAAVAVTVAAAAAAAWMKIHSQSQLFAVVKIQNKLSADARGWEDSTGEIHAGTDLRQWDESAHSSASLVSRWLDRSKKSIEQGVHEYHTNFDPHDNSVCSGFFCPNFCTQPKHTTYIWQLNFLATQEPSACLPSRGAFLDCTAGCSEL